MKIFATAKVFRGKRALLPTVGKRCFKFSIAICINCVGKMLIWGHFWGVMELLLKNYLGHFLTIEKTFDFLFLESAIKPTPLLHVNIQMPYRTECNWSNWWQPECFYEPASPSPLWRVASRSFQSAIYTGPTGWHGSDKSAVHERTWVFQKANRRLQNYE